MARVRGKQVASDILATDTGKAAPSAPYTGLGVGMRNLGYASVRLVSGSANAGVINVGDVVVKSTTINSAVDRVAANQSVLVLGVAVTGTTAPGQAVEVATAGVVNVNVQGAITRGQRLGTSTTLGRAAGFAATAINTVLGKALAANAAGPATIPCLLTLN